MVVEWIVRAFAGFAASYLATGWILQEFLPGIPALHIVATIVLTVVILLAFALAGADR